MVWMLVFPPNSYVGLSVPNLVMKWNICEVIRPWEHAKPLSRVRYLATSWAAASQAPPSMGFSRQEYWSGVPLPSPVWRQFGGWREGGGTANGCEVSFWEYLGIGQRWWLHNTMNMPELSELSVHFNGMTFILYAFYLKKKKKILALLFYLQRF